MKPDARTDTTPSSYQRATELAEEVIPPAAKKRAVEPTHESVLVQEANEYNGDASKALRLPSIKHLQLDLGVSWPVVEQFFSASPSPSRQSPQPLLFSSSAAPSPVASPAFPLSPPLSSPSSTPKLLKEHPTVIQPSHAIVARSPASSAPLSLSTSSVKTLFPSSSPAPTNLAASAPPAMSSMISSYQIPLPSQTNNSTTSQTSQAIVPVVSNNFGFIETTFTNTPVKKAHRRRPAHVDKTSLYCHNCGSKNTPEWRRGPSGPATLCNACGLAYAKRVRQEEDAQTIADSDVTTQIVPYAYSTWCRPQPQQPTTTSHTHTRPMQLVKGMPVRINSHTFHNYTPPTPHPSLRHPPGYPITNQVFY